MNTDSIALPAAERTLPMMLRHAARHGARPLLRMPGGAWSHEDVADVAARRATPLAEASVAFGDRVALMCGNRIELLETFVGCGWLGAVAVPIDTAATALQIEDCLAETGARLLVIESVFLPRLMQLDFARTVLRAIWIVGEAPAAAADLPLQCEAYPAAGHAVPSAAVKPDDALTVLYTSGASAPGGAVPCTHAQYYCCGLASAQALGVTRGDVLCTTLPLFQLDALHTLAQALLVGCRVVFERRFSAAGFWPATRAAEATVIQLGDAMVPLLLALPPAEDERPHRVRIGLGAGVSASAGVAFRERTGIELIEGCGSAWRTMR